MATYYHYLLDTTVQSRTIRFYLKFDVTEGERRIADNTTKVTYSVAYGVAQTGASDYVSAQELYHKSGGIGYREKSAPITVKLNGLIVYENSAFSLDLKSDVTARREQIIFSKTETIQHNEDGTLQLFFDVAYPTNKDKTVIVYLGSDLYENKYVEGSATKTIDITPFPRAAILSAPNFNDEENPTITYDNSIAAVGTSLHAAISFDGTTAHIPYREIAPFGESYTFALTDAEREILYDNTVTRAHAPVWFLLKNALNGVDYVTKAERTLTIINATPILSPVIKDINETTKALTGNENSLIKYFSNARASLNTWTRKKATLTGYYIKNGTSKVEEAAHTFENVTYNVFDFFVIDSRNNTKSETLKPPMVEYKKLTISAKDTKPNTDGKWAIECAGVFFNDSFGAVTNALMVQFRYKEQGGTYTDWQSMAVAKNGDNYTATSSVSGLDYRKTYVLECKATDLLMEVNTGESAVKSLPVFHWSKTDFVHETPVTFNDVINGDVHITGDLRLKGEGNYGNKLYFGDSAYAYIGEETDDALTIDATKLNLSAQEIKLSNQVDIIGGLSFNGGSVKFGTWTPALKTAAAVSSYTLQNGWYMKLGSCVVLGFNLKANCNSGYNSTALAITGAPFAPTDDAFGGGVAYNIYVTSGFNFEAWAITTSGEISARLQPCNNTTATNLNISSTSYYPISGGAVTLGGTICFMTNE